MLLTPSSLSAKSSRQLDEAMRAMFEWVVVGPGHPPVSVHSSGSPATVVLARILLVTPFSFPAGWHAAHPRTSIPPHHRLFFLTACPKQESQGALSAATESAVRKRMIDRKASSSTRVLLPKRKAKTRKEKKRPTPWRSPSTFP